jgi:hypothetical protein
MWKEAVVAEFAWGVRVKAQSIRIVYQPRIAVRGAALRETADC